MVGFSSIGGAPIGGLEVGEGQSINIDVPSVVYSYVVYLEELIEDEKKRLDDL